MTDGGLIRWPRQVRPSTEPGKTCGGLSSPIGLDHIDIMRDGNYAMRISADGLVGNGHFAMHGNSGTGQDGRFEVQGRLVERRAAVDAVFHMRVEPDAIGNTGVPKDFSVHLDGAANNDSFHVIGVGPLGLIIAIDGEWMSPPDGKPDSH